MNYNRPSIPLSNAPRFLITRLSAVGDCIHTIPLVYALREHFPDCFVAWATQTGPATLLDGIEAIDEIVRVPRDWLKSPRTWLNLRRKLHSLNVDVAIDPQSLTKSSALGWLSNAQYRVGFDRPQGRELSLMMNNLLIESASDHVVDRYLELLAPLGISDTNVRFEMPDSDEESVNEFLNSNGLAGKDFAIVNPGAGWPSKVWPAERYGAIAAHLGLKHQLPSIVTWAGDDELEMAKSICETSNGCANIANKTTLTELRSLIRRAKLFVGSDTGPMHLAVAVGTSCISIYGPTNPARCGPYGPGHIALHTSDETNHKLRSDDNSAMLKITTSDVISAVERTLISLRDKAA